MLLTTCDGVHDNQVDGILLENVLLFLFHRDIIGYLGEDVHVSLTHVVAAHVAADDHNSHGARVRELTLISWLAYVT